MWPMPQMRTYRGYCLLEGLDVAEASNEDLQRLLPVGGFAMADASDKDLHRVLL